MLPLYVTTAFAAPLAVSTVSATIVCGFMLARYAGTRARLAARERESAFEREIEAFLLGAIRGRELIRAAAALEPDLFWEAISTRAARFGRRGFRDLEQPLERTRHVFEEKFALRDTAPVRRELAARRLAWIGARRHHRSLRRAMIQGPEPVTLAAALALARVRDAAAFRWILAHPQALEHRRPQARLALLRAFGPHFAGRLAAALAAGIGEPRMERAAIEALALARHAPATDTIAARLGHAWRDVRVAAARALGQLRATGHTPALVAALADPEWQVRAQAALALGRLGATEAIAALRAALHDPAWWVRRHAAYALASLGETGRAALREVTASDDDRYARDIAAEALGGGFPPANRGRARVR